MNPRPKRSMRLPVQTADRPTPWRHPTSRFSAVPWCLGVWSQHLPNERAPSGTLSTARPGGGEVRKLRSCMGRFARSALQEWSRSNKSSSHKERERERPPKGGVEREGKNHVPRKEPTSRCGLLHVSGVGGVGFRTSYRFWPEVAQVCSA